MKNIVYTSEMVYRNRFFKTSFVQLKVNEAISEHKHNGSARCTFYNTSKLGYAANAQSPTMVDKYRYMMLKNTF